MGGVFGVKMQKNVACAFGNRVSACFLPQAGLRAVYFAMVLAFGTIGFAAPSAAQIPLATPADNPIYDKISATDMAGILGELGITSQLVAGDPGEAAIMVAQLPGGNRFLLQFLNCEDPAAAARCNDFALILSMSGSGITYDDINDFNIAADGTKAVYSAEHQILVFSDHTIVLGGLGKQNINLTIGLFFNDLNTFFTSRQAGATAISLEPGPAAVDAGKLLKSANVARNSKALEKPSKNATAVVDDQLVAVAIHNKWDVDFPDLTTDKIEN